MTIPKIPRVKKINPKIRNAGLNRIPTKDGFVYEAKNGRMFYIPDDSPGYVRWMKEHPWINAFISGLTGLGTGISANLTYDEIKNPESRTRKLKVSGGRGKRRP